MSNNFLSAKKGKAMKNFRKKAFLFAVVMLCCQSAVSCADKQKNSESSEINVTSNSESTTSEEEADLGEYVVSDSGIKLYYSSDEFSPALIATLEKYFASFESEDYDAYLDCIQDDYIEKMNKYLESDFGYDLKKSFQNQCQNLKEMAGGDYKLTRIKAELPETDGSEDYLKTLDTVFNVDFYDSVVKNSDSLHDMMFYVMAEVDGEEKLLLSEYEIVFAEKDGNYYTFG